MAHVDTVLAEILSWRKSYAVWDLQVRLLRSDYHCKIRKSFSDLWGEIFERNPPILAVPGFVPQDVVPPQVQQAPIIGVSIEKRHMLLLTVAGISLYRERQRRI
jgi:hypothetical protein